MYVSNVIQEVGIHLQCSVERTTFKSIHNCGIYDEIIICRSVYQRVNNVDSFGYQAVVFNMHLS